jgi:hypothetical protein
MHRFARMKLWVLLASLAFVACVPACSSTDDAAPDPLDTEGEAPPETGAEPAEPIPDVEEAAEADAGAPDAGPPPMCALAVFPKATYLKYGLHPRASDALAFLKVSAGRISQTIGTAAASAGTHAQDGTSEGRPYSAATDLSVRDMTDAQVSVFVDKLTSVGFVAYYRKPGYDGWPSSEARHIHAIWVAARMKLSLRNQVRDWRVGKNALASHTTYKYKTWSPCWRDLIWKQFLTANPATN